VPAPDLAGEQSGGQSAGESGQPEALSAEAEPGQRTCAVEPEGGLKGHPKASPVRPWQQGAEAQQSAEVQQIAWALEQAVQPWV